MRRLLAVVALVLLAVGLSGCSENEGDDETVRAAIRKTEKLARRYTYTDDAGGQKLVVQGIVEDDFRHAERLSINDQPAIDQTVVDDAVALRFLNTELVPRFLKPSEATVDVPGGPKGVPVNDVLGTRRWVVDEAGAPPPQARRQGGPGADPVHDALTALRYVENSMDEALYTRIFNPEALDYKPAEDPFPHPEGSVKRYDMIRPPLPRAGGDTGGANQEVPDTRHFRRMSVYIEDGLIIEVREAIDVETRLRELSRVYGVDFPDRPRAELAGIALEAINALRVGQGNEAIRMRTMTLAFTELGKPQTVGLPTADAVIGDLRLRSEDLDNRGAAPKDDEKPGDGGSGSGSGAGGGGSDSGGSGEGGGDTPTP